MPHRRPTLKDIATATGLSVATVSRALSGKGRMSKATRLRVKQAAAELEYLPDPVLGRLASYRRNTEKVQAGSALAVLTDAKGKVHPAGEMRIEGARQRAKQLGYQIELFRLSDLNWSIKRLASVLRSRGIEGLLVDAVRSPGSYDGFPWEEFAPIGMGVSFKPLRISTVTGDVFAAVRLAWIKAVEAGYAKPGLVLREEGETESYYRSLASGELAQTVWTTGQPLPPIIAQPRSPNAADVSQLDSWIRQSKPDVVLGHATVLQSLLKLGYRVPGDLAFASFALLAEEIEDDSISGAQIDLAQCGSLAVELCHMALQRPSTRHPEMQVLHLIEPKWHDGATLPRRTGLASSQAERRARS